MHPQISNIIKKINLLESDTKVTSHELRDVFDCIRQAIIRKQKIEDMQKAAAFYPGDIVEFPDRYKKIWQARVLKVNSKTLKVQIIPSNQIWKIWVGYAKKVEK
jgi:hypothetical protein